jgi:hypothetical protein
VCVRVCVTVCVCVGGGGGRGRGECQSVPVARPSLREPQHTYEVGTFTDWKEMAPGVPSTPATIVQLKSCGRAL